MSLKTTTISVLFNININFSHIDLLILGLFLKPDNILIGLYLDYMRGLYIIEKGEKFSNKKGFYNQLSLLIKIQDNKKIKCKLFTNGNVHLCGCKDEKDIYKVYDIIIQILKNFYYKSKISLYPIGSLIVDSNNFIFNPLTKSISGLIKSNQIYFNGENVKPIENTDLWISKKFNHLYKKNIYTSHGIVISSIMKKDIKVKKYCNDKKNIENKVILEKIKEIKKLQTYNFCDNFEEELDLSYKNLVKNSYINNIQVILYNCVYTPLTNFNKQDIYNKLNYMKFHVVYNPLIYHGVKLIYFFNQKNNNFSGKCTCDNKQKCICDKGTIVFCSNNKILLYGFKIINIDKNIIKFIDDIL